MSKVNNSLLLQLLETSKIGTYIRRRKEEMMTRRWVVGGQAKQGYGRHSKLAKNSVVP